jgi:hypothetical protein
MPSFIWVNGAEIHKPNLVIGHAANGARSVASQTAAVRDESSPMGRDPST